MSEQVPDFTSAHRLSHEGFLRAVDTCMERVPFTQGLAIVERAGHKIEFVNEPGRLQQVSVTYPLSDETSISAGFQHRVEPGEVEIFQREGSGNHEFNQRTIQSANATYSAFRTFKTNHAELNMLTDPVENGVVLMTWAGVGMQVLGGINAAVELVFVDEPPAPQQPT